MKKHEIENNYILSLIQAMLGAISNNFRAVWITVEGEKLNICFLLYTENNEDREEIEDIIFEFEALQGKIIDITSNIIINDKTWLPPENARMVFLKKA